jgi:hypothetical protein
MSSLGFTKGMEAIPVPPPPLAYQVNERRWLRRDGFS